ncbi:MmpS family transport accessory protein [Leucobacter tenebrionis]|uniref:MmpS family transport accessory protein n=1 Tax=Leucobacter tenebrionis TaxID=2873270 RepID=UPI001CA7239B|nr:MmpS family transport accessory protein [Leucobacter tenebrionis]QZY52015.1 PASTA domain-containing protein [Leucobacter tenebrionis]
MEEDSFRDPDVPGSSSSAPRKLLWGLSNQARIKITAFGIGLLLFAVGGIWLVHDFSQRRTVPDVLGRMPSGAIHMLEEVDLIASTTIPPSVGELREFNQNVAKQVPAAGEAVRAGDEVQIIVGPRKVEVPDFVGVTLIDAKELADQGEFEFEDGLEDNAPGSSWPISAQSIQAGEISPAGSVIELEFDIPEIIMPDVSGQKLQDAVIALETIGLKAVSVGDGDHVISSDIAAGTTLEPFTSISLSTGYVMPDVVGKPLREAREALKNFPNTSTSTSSTFEVTAQSIPAGSIIPKDTEILLTVPGPSTTYRILGNGSVSAVTWAAPGAFSIQQATGVSLPWEVTFPTDTGTAVFNAQLQDGDTITCQILRNGKVVRELTSTGAFAFVQCG